MIKQFFNRLFRKPLIHILSNEPYKPPISDIVKTRLRRREDDPSQYILAILDKKKDRWVYRKSKKNHSFWTLKRNGEENDKISLPIKDWSVLERYGYYIIGTKKKIAELHKNTKNDTEILIKQVVKQECPKGSCDYKGAS